MSPGVPERRETAVRGLRISYLVKGSHGPTTMYLHGLGADAEQTRPLASGVPGRLVLVDLPSHGHSDDAGELLRLDDLVDIASTIAAEEGATGALGVSLGSAVLLRWLTRRAFDLDRAVLYLPAAVTMPRPAGRLRNALASAQALQDYVGGELPDAVASTALARRWLQARTAALQRPGIAAYADMLEREAPIDDAASARQSPTRLLAVGARGDRLHPAQAATEAADCFDNGRAYVFADAAPLWTARRELRGLLSSFLGDATAEESADGGIRSDNLES
ncbi:MAG: alpha/beta fold hydrolase [Cumulibacter sp.]